MFKRYGYILSLLFIGLSFIWAFGLLILPQLGMFHESITRYDNEKFIKAEMQLENLYKKVYENEENITFYKSSLESCINCSREEIFRLNSKIQNEILFLKKNKNKIENLENTIDKPVKYYSLENYKVFFTNYLHLIIFLKSIFVSLFVTFLGVLICYPVAFYMSKIGKARFVTVLFLCITTPYWLNELLRALAWKIILSRNGLVNVTLDFFQLTDEPILFLENNIGMILALLYAFSIFLVLPMYNSMISLDNNQLDASLDLGASRLKMHYYIVIPSIKNGIAAGAIMTFLLILGTYGIPVMLGGLRSLWYTQLIYQWFETGRDWGTGASYSIILMFSSLIIVFTLKKVFKINLSKMVN